MTSANAARTRSSSRGWSPVNASTAASATAAFCAWCAPYSGRKTSSYRARRPCSDTVWPPTAGTRETTPNSMPSRATVAPTSVARASSTSATSGVCAARIAVAPALMIPAFSRAIAATLSPR